LYLPNCNKLERFKLSNTTYLSESKAGACLSGAPYPAWKY